MKENEVKVSIKKSDIAIIERLHDFVYDFIGNNKSILNNYFKIKPENIDDGILKDARELTGLLYHKMNQQIPKPYCPQCGWKLVIRDNIDSSENSVDFDWELKCMNFDCNIKLINITTNEELNKIEAQKYFAKIFPKKD